MVHTASNASTIVLRRPHLPGAPLALASDVQAGDTPFSNSRKLSAAKPTKVSAAVAAGTLTVARTTAARVRRPGPALFWHSYRSSHLLCAVRGRFGSQVCSSVQTPSPIPNVFNHTDEVVQYNKEQVTRMKTSTFTRTRPAKDTNTQTQAQRENTLVRASAMSPPPPNS